MYQHFYNLNRAPFQATVDPDFYWEGESTAKFLKALRSDLEQHGKLILVTGSPGCGKTTLISTALAALDPSVLVAMISDSRLTIQEFYDLTAHAFHLSGQSTSRETFHEEIRALLHQANDQKKHVLLVVDEAQQLSAELIEEIEEIIDLRSNERDRLSVCLVGQLGDVDGLKGRIIKAFENRDMVLHYLAPLTPDETSSYIQHRLKVAGVRHTLFTDDAVREIYRYSGGYPVQINIICDVALFIGCNIKASTIEADLIRLNAEKLQFPHASQPSEGITRTVGWGNADRNTNDDSNRSEPDADAAMLQEPPGGTPPKAGTDIGQNSAPKRSFALPAYGLLLALAIGGGGYVYFAQRAIGRSELPAQQIGAAVEAGADTPAGQITNVSTVPQQHAPASPSSSQLGSAPDTAGTPSLHEAAPVAEAENQAGDEKERPVRQMDAVEATGTDTPVGQITDVNTAPQQHAPAVPSSPLNEAAPVDQQKAKNQTGKALSKVVESDDSKDAFRQNITAGRPDALVLPQLQNDIQDFLHEVTQELLQEKSAPLAPDTEQTTAVDPLPIEAEVAPGKVEAEDEIEKDATEETVPPVAKGHDKLKEFLAAGAFGEDTAPTPQEQKENDTPEQPAASQTQETAEQKVEPSPESAIDWLLEKKALKEETPAE
jgi:general secretion pathway protein A